MYKQYVRTKIMHTPFPTHKLEGTKYEINMRDVILYENSLFRFANSTGSGNEACACGFSSTMIEIYKTVPGVHAAVHI